MDKDKEFADGFLSYWDKYSPVTENKNLCSYGNI